MLYETTQYDSAKIVLEYGNDFNQASAVTFEGHY
jgi:hypothetical protein